MCAHFVYYFSYLIKVVALLYFICCYRQVLVNKDIHKGNQALIYVEGLDVTGHLIMASGHQGHCTSY